MIAQIRMFVAEWLLGLAVSISPKNNDGALLAYHVAQYMGAVIAKIGEGSE